MADPQLKAELIIEAQQALGQLNTFFKNIENLSNNEGKKSGDNFQTKFTEEISKIKIDLANNIKVDPTKLSAIKTSINTALSDGKLTNTQAVGLFGNLESVGKNTGFNTGKFLIAGITTALAGFSISNLLGGITTAVGAYRDLSLSNLNLQGAISATNNRVTEQNKVLTSTTSTIEQKALALGISTDKLYKNISATNQAKEATSGLEQSLKLETRAFEDSQRVLENKLTTQERSVNTVEKEIAIQDKQIAGINRLIQSIQKETDEKAKQLRLSLGGNELDNEKNKLEISKNNLKIKQDEAKLSGDNVAVKFIGFEINRLDDLLNLNRDKLDNINLQTIAIKKQDDVQIQGLESQKAGIELTKQSLETKKQELQEITKTTQELIKANKITFDADIEPLKRKIEDIKASISNIRSSGESVQVLDPKKVEEIEKLANQSLNKNLKVDDGAINTLVNDLVTKFGRTISKSDLSQVVSDLIQGGLTDVNQLNQLVERFVETSSKSRVGTQNQGEALQNLAQGFKNGNSAITENSGLSENFATNIIPKGTQKLIENALAMGDKTTADRLNKKELTDSETAQAKYYGTIQATNDTVGTYKKALDNGLLSQSEFNQTQQKTSQIFGKELTPAYAGVIGFGNNLLDQFNQITKGNPTLILGLTGLAGVLTLVAVGLTIATAATVLFGVGIGVVLFPILLIIGGIVLLGAIIYGLKLAWDNNLGGIQEKTTFVFKVISDYVTDFKNHWQERIGEIIGFFLTLPIKLPLLVAQAIGFIVDLITKQDWNMIWNGLLDGAKGVLNSISEFFKNFNWKGLGNGLIDFVKGLLRGIGAGIPGADNIINPLIDQLPRFATGGLITGAGTGTSDSILARLSSGEFVVNQRDTERNLPMLQAMNSGNYRTNYNQQQYDQSTVNNYNNYSSGNFGFSLSQKYKTQ